VRDSAPGRGPKDRSPTAAARQFEDEAEDEFEHGSLPDSGPTATAGQVEDVAEDDFQHVELLFERFATLAIREDFNSRSRRW
jgi:hypothetical protein